MLLAGCAILQEDTILLLHRTKTDWYELPGGKLNSDESAEAAAVRELKEELCCDVTIIRQLGQKEFQENGYTLEYLWFLARLQDDQSPSLGEPEKFSHFRYLPVQALSRYKLSPNMQNLLQAIERKAIKLA